MDWMVRLFGRNAVTKDQQLSFASQKVDMYLEDTLHVNGSQI